MLAYLYVCCVTRINLLILHIFMYNVISDLDNIYMHIYRMSPYSTGCNYDKGQSVKPLILITYSLFKYKIANNITTLNTLLLVIVKLNKKNYQKKYKIRNNISTLNTLSLIIS